MRGFLLGVLLACCLSGPAAADLHRLRVFPNDALTVRAIAQGPDGFLWLATSTGLYRFDGFHYHKINKFPFASARYVAFTADGSLWVAGLEGLTRFVHNRFETVQTDEVPSMAAYPDQLFIRSRPGMARVGLDGSVRQLGHVTRKDLLIDSAGMLWAVCDSGERACRIDPARPEELHTVSVPPGQESIVRDALGRTWTATEEQATLWENHGIAVRLARQASHVRDRPGPLLPGRRGEVWFLGETIRGLVSGIEFHDRADRDRFSPISGLEDGAGRLWAATLGQGLVEWTKDPEWQRWSPQDFSGDLPVQVVRSPRGPVVATQKNLYRLDAATGHWSPLTGQDRLYWALLPLPDGGFLASIGKLGDGCLARLSPDGKVVERLPNLLPAPDQYRVIVEDGKGRWWVGTKRTLLRIEGRPGSLRLRPEQLPAIAEGVREDAVDLQVDPAGRLWAGYEAGIAWLDDHDRWHRLATDAPVASVRSFALAGDEIWVAHRRSGAFSRLHRQGDLWKVTRFSAKAGYEPVETEFLKRDSRGWIWRGSSQGVHVADGRHLAPADWLHLHLGNGLATNETGQYGFLEDTDGSVWIAGEEGITHLRPRASWFDAPHAAPAPAVTRVEADGRVFLFPDLPPPALAPATRILRIDVGALQSSPFRDYPLRYRLLPLANDWRLSRDGSLEFRNLPENAYKLEIGHAGNGSSAVATYAFQVGSPPSGLPWLSLVLPLVAAGALVPMVRHVPALARARFRVEKAVFLLRRRHALRHSYDAAAAGVPDYSGETLAGHYHLRRIVSRGGFSVVYEARDLRGGDEPLAVKVLNRTPGRESWVRDRFAHEVAALGSVDHPGVVRILDSWVSSAGEPCLAMPFLPGPTLRAALEQRPFRPPRAARVIRQLGAALAAVHRHGIIHRDLKPENLILVEPETDREQAVIIDFGTAGLRSAENELAATRLLAGSFHYMAPERLTGHYSPASDVFSLAVMILEMLSAKRLADLRVIFSDPAFPTVLEQALDATLDEDTSATLASQLAPAYDPDPRRRPKDVEAWSQQIAITLQNGGRHRDYPLDNNVQ